MIDQASFRNFKALKRVDLDLRRLNVVVGPNASGKTSILDGLHVLCGAVPNPAGQPFSSTESVIYTRGSSGALEIAASSRKHRVRLCAIPPEHFSSTHPLRNGGYSQSGWNVTLEHQDNRANWREVGEHDRWNLAAIFSSNLLRLDATRLAGPSYSVEPKPQIAPSGEGLATALAYIALNQPETFETIQEQLRRIVPSVKRLRFDKFVQQRVEQEFVTVDGTSVPRNVSRSLVHDIIVFDFANSADILSPLVSEGTLIALGLLTIILSPFRPKTVLIDDLEHGLHPKAQREVVRVLKQFLAADSELQIIATTHSPYILDELEPDEVLLATCDDEGHTLCGRLPDHPDFDRWKEEMTPGEFWTVVGEQWLRPAATAEQSQ